MQATLTTVLMLSHFTDPKTQMRSARIPAESSEPVYIHEDRGCIKTEKHVTNECTPRGVKWAHLGKDCQSP